jgi:hypothetical protein
MSHDPYESLLRAQARADKAEARVAELEAAVDHIVEITVELCAKVADDTPMHSEDDAGWDAQKRIVANIRALVADAP